MRHSRSKAEEKDTVRCSISFPARHYEVLERIAAEKRVSLAWVVRDAVERYLAQQNGPLPVKRKARPGKGS